MGHYPFACRERGTSLSRTQCHQPFVAGMVFPSVFQRLTLPALCTFQCWLSPWASCVPVCNRASRVLVGARLDLVDFARGICCMLRRLRVAGAERGC